MDNVNYSRYFFSSWPVKNKDDSTVQIQVPENVAYDTQKLDMFLPQTCVGHNPAVRLSGPIFRLPRGLRDGRFTSGGLVSPRDGRFTCGGLVSPRDGRFTSGGLVSPRDGRFTLFKLRAHGQSRCHFPVVTSNLVYLSGVPDARSIGYHWPLNG